MDTDGDEEATMSNGEERMWLLKLARMLLGYAIVATPTALLVHRVRRLCAEGQFETPNWLLRFIKKFAVGSPEYVLLTSNETKSTSGSRSERFWADGIALVGYFIGIQLSLVSMGFLQEMILTQKYVRLDNPHVSESFGDVQFLVLLNRLFGLALSGSFLFYSWKSQPVHVLPLYNHAYTSFANIMSSWCQYEALKFVSFPTQTICKASKIVPTMLMARIVRGEKYSGEEYLTGLALATGASLFFLASSHPMSSAVDRVTSLSGVALMAGYLTFDAFTVNWQKALFDTRPRLSKFQMMCGVNGISALLCTVSLVEQGVLLDSAMFLVRHRNLLSHAMLLSLSGAIGQVFIYMTIERFGPIVFTVMMTLRQIFSIILSSVYYVHPISILSSIGLLMAFSAILFNTWRQYHRVRLRPIVSGSDSRLA